VGGVGVVKRKLTHMEDGPVFIAGASMFRRIRGQSRWVQGWALDEEVEGEVLDAVSDAVWSKLDARSDSDDRDVEQAGIG